jgi:hypothetical protein
MTPHLLALLALMLLDVAVIAGWTTDSRDGRDWWRGQWPPTRRPVSRQRRSPPIMAMCLAFAGIFTKGR